MEERRTGIVAASAYFAHAHFLKLLIASYAIAAVAPWAGLWIRDVTFGEVGLAGSHSRLSLPMVMLAVLLMNAGLGTDPAALRGMLRRPKLLGVGLATNLLVPIAYIFGITAIMTSWHNAAEVQVILVGLALVASMPIAGSSTAWAQNADGELALSLALVLSSTLLSPLLTPLALRAVGIMATGDYAESLEGLASGGTGAFLLLCVLGPSLFGISARGMIGDRWYAAARPGLKLVNSAILLVLNYANASASLPQAVSNPDADFLAVTLAIVAGQCMMAFAAGWGVSGLLGATRPQRTSLMFGLGMNNNGTALVLASAALERHPRVMLPIILYNLAQHLVAGIADRLMSGATPPGGSGAVQVMPLQDDEPTPSVVATAGCPSPTR